MRDFSIDLIWTKLQMACAALGGWIGYFVGGMDGLLIALIVFMVLDYITAAAKVLRQQSCGKEAAAQSRRAAAVFRGGGSCTDH